MSKTHTAIDRDYNPEHDLCSDVDGKPVLVTWAEYDLQQQIHRLKAMYDQQITSLNERINALERVNKHKLIRSATTYRLTINRYATEDVEAKSAIYALAEYAYTRIPPVKKVLIQAQGDEATLISLDDTIEARPLEWREMSPEQQREVQYEHARNVVRAMNAVEYPNTCEDQTD